MNCAPLADLAEPQTHPVLRNRFYGSQVPIVVAAGARLAEGLMAGGVLPVVKHLPGYGRAAVDSHLDLPRLTEPLDALEARDFAPFRALADLPMAHDRAYRLRRDRPGQSGDRIARRDAADPRADRL